MPIRAFLDEKAFGPEEINLMNAAFQGVCIDLGLQDKTDPACALVAKRVVQMAHGYTNPDALRAAVLASLKVKP